MESRLKSATGTKKIDEILDDSNKWPALEVVMQDPAVVNKMCEHYGVLPDAKFFDRVAGLYNQGLINTRSILYSHSGDVSMACMQDQELECRTIAQRPNTPNLPHPPVKGRDNGASAGVHI